MSTDSDFPLRVQCDDDFDTEYYRQLQVPTTPGFKVSGIYPTLMGRQDINYTSPEQAQHIRKVQRDPVKDIDLYRVYHGRNMDHLAKVKQQQTTLKMEQMETEQKHQELLAKIKRQSERRRSVIRNRGASSLTEMDDTIPCPLKPDGVTTGTPQISTAEPAVEMDFESKPKWSLTETQNEMVMEKEVDELLDFVGSLQIDEFLENMEMHQKLTTIKERIENLQQKEQELKDRKLQIEQREQDIANKEQGEMRQDLGECDKENVFAGNHIKSTTANTAAVAKESTSIASKRESPSTANLVESVPQKKVSTADQIAADIVTGSSRMKNIHSKQSIRSIVDTRKSMTNPWSDVATRKINAIIERQKYDPVEGRSMNEPKRYTVCDRLQPLKIRQKMNGSDISNLPYLFRHPGV